MNGTPFRRHPANPILDRHSIDHPGILVFNPGVTRFDDRFLMAYRTDHGRWGDPHITGSDIRFSWSDNGVDWKPAETGPIDRAAAIDLLQPLEPHRDLERELWRVYDPRLATVDLDGTATLVMTFAADTTRGLRPALAVSHDGATWTARALGAPDNRNQVLFPRPIGGRWARLERPMQHYGGEAMGAGDHAIWVSLSPDLTHWGDTRLVGGAELFPSADAKVGPGSTPIETDAGWLCLVHTVSEDPAAGKRGWEPTWQRTYRVDALLLDRDDPARVVAVSPEPLLAPDPGHRYESEGFRNDVVFPGGTIVVSPDRDGLVRDGGSAGPELWMYYGAADTVIALATAPLADVVDFVLSGPRPAR
jgi:beta-1,4-mannooligosaccharide/beta-1,4-mannosyl-N-acetylglucosamine phosphorylase